MKFLKASLLAGYLILPFLGISQLAKQPMPVKIGQDYTDDRTFTSKTQNKDSIHPALSPFLNWYTKNRLKPGNEIYQANHLLTVNHQGYTSVIETSYNIPAWVEHSINSNDLLHPGKFQREDNYAKDSLYPTLKSDLYQGSGYDHGHLAAARDFKHDENQYAESNNMTNMSPQHACFNQKGWCMLESLCREWAQEDSNSVTYIVSGPLLNSAVLTNLFIDTLCISPKLQVYVPSFFFKAICIYNKKLGTAMALGFIVPNSDVDNEEIQFMKVRIDELEIISGLNFFSTLPDKLESKYESILPQMNYNHRSECGSKPCDKVYNKRIKPADRIKLKCE